MINAKINEIAIRVLYGYQFGGRSKPVNQGPKEVVTILQTRKWLNKKKQ